MSCGVLDALRGPGYGPVHAIPHRWPVLHAHDTATVSLLWAEGVLERVPGPASGGAVPAYRVAEAADPPVS
jgi:hypothetical protein